MRRGVLLDTGVRGFALFGGAFLLLSVLAGLRDPVLDTSHWLIDVRGLPSGLRSGVLLLLGIAAAWWGIAPPESRRGRLLAAGALAVLGYAAVIDTAQVVAATRSGAFELGLPPLSAAIATGFLAAAWRARNGEASAPWPAVTASAGASAAAFAVALMACFGTTDYRRPADAVVVLGARAYANGEPSLALGDRVRTAASLVTSGRAPLLVVSGGPGDGAYHETEVMRRVAIEAGVAPEQILTDDDGLNTRATAEHAADLLRACGAHDALVVSHAYHLPRVKAAFDRVGFTAFTVPAEETRTLVGLPYYVARETAAWWAYWLRDRGT